LWLAAQWQRWKEEWEDFQRFCHALSLFYGEVKEWASDMAAGGLQARRARQMARLQAREAQLRGALQSQLDALGTPWRDLTWQQEAQHMTPERQEQQQSEETTQGGAQIAAVAITACFWC
jgi:hypothetical protein